MLKHLYKTIILPASIVQLFKKGKYLIAFLFLVICPLFFDGLVIEPSNVPRFLYVNLVLCIVLVISFFRKTGILIPGRYAMLLLLAFYAINIISTTWALNKADAIYEAQKVVMAIMVILLVYNSIKTNAEEQDLVKSLILIGGLYITYSSYQICRLPNFDFDTLYKIIAFAEHKNLLGSFLFLLLCFFLYAFFFMENVWKYTGISLTIITLLLLLFLQVRSVYAALAVTGVLFLIYAISKFKINRARIFIGVMISVCLLSVLIFTNPAIAKRLNVFSYSTKGSGAERLKLWNKTVHVIQDHPVLGVGVGNWQYNYSIYGVNDIENITVHDISFQRPHNDLLWIASETGLLGLALIILIMGFVLKKSYPEIKRGNLKTFLFFSFLTGLLVESLFSFPKERITHIVLGSVMLALLFKTLTISVDVSQQITKRIIPCFVLILCFSLFVGAYRLKGEYYTTLLLDAKEANDANGVVNYGTKALSPFYLTDPTSTPIYTFLGWGYAANHKTDSLAYVSERAYEIAPYDYEVLSNYGFSLEKSGKRTEGREILIEALRINSTYEPALLNMFILEYNAKNYEEAFRYLSLIPDHQTKYANYYTKVIQKIAR